MDASASSSKVTVEYHDPSGVFPLIADEISNRLPLRNLNWQSPSRPLRQIKFLHVDFVADNAAQNGLRPPTAQQEPKTANSFDIVSNGAGPYQNAVKERRHQIPGLKKSPYLKIYVLRCDDSENYKDSDRKQIRDWVRSISGVDSQRDNHDAFEWMILHVVIPDTVAASEPRWRDTASKDSDEIKERPKTSSKWPGKSGKTVFDRLRTDFNESGKSGQDRVAQIRLLKSKIAPDLLPTPAVAPTLEESPQERENAWIDLVTKLKTFILNPFDLRVRQYEADILEQESRRVLPGWNFCTFFIHKEGLANALESIGLVQDALAIYDELSIGLETVVQDLASGRAAGTATNFVSFTDDIQIRILGTQKQRTDGASHIDISVEDDRASGLFSKDYRELIVTSSISVFDFLCYIFSRQKTLLLRLANTQSSQGQSGDRGKGGREDPTLASEVCWRTLTFIHTAARNLRQDLNTNATTQRAGGAALDIDRLVYSWIYTCTGQVLQQTEMSALQDFMNPKPKTQVAARSGVRRRTTMTLGLGADAYPQRSTSLPGRTPDVPEPKRPISRPGSSGSDVFRPQSMPGSDLLKPSGTPGLTELATHRAELVRLRRQMLEKIAARHGWYAGCSSIERQLSGTIKEPASADDTKSSPLSEHRHNDLHDVTLRSLRYALRNQASFMTTFEQLTQLAIQHYSAAKQNKSAESLKCDMAILKSQSHDYTAALSYFDQVIPQYVHQPSLAGFAILKLYSACLRDLQHSEAHVRTLLNLLSWACGIRYEQSTRFMTPKENAHDQRSYISGIFSDLAAVSSSLSHDVTVAAEKYFHEIQLGDQIKLWEGRDGFSLRLSFQYLLEDQVKVKPSARLVSVDDSSHEIWLHSEKALTMETGLNVVDLHAAFVACGAFFVEKVVLATGKIRFERNLGPKIDETPLTTAETKRDQNMAEIQMPPCVYIYPSERAFRCHLDQSKNVEIGKAKRIEIVLDSGQNDVQSMHLKIKPSSAGLRLHLGDASSSGTELMESGNATQGQLSLGCLKPGKNARVLVPYTLEQNIKDIDVRVEIEYYTPSGSSVLLVSQSVTNMLALDVDVNDKFHLDALYSQFTIRAVGQAPLSIVDARLDESAAYSISSPKGVPSPMMVYNSQPMQLVYQVRRKPQMQRILNKYDTALVLKLRYRTVDDIFHERLRSVFTHEVRTSAYADLIRLLIFTLITRSRSLLTRADMEMAAITGEMKVPGFDEIGWCDVLPFLHKPLQDGLERWLRDWHDNTGAIDIYEDAAGEAVTRTLTVRVDVPTVDRVFSSSLKLVNPDSRMHRGSPIVTMGSPVQATVRIKHTDAWRVKDVAKAASDEPDYVCEIMADSDVWLVGGQRRCHFKTHEKLGHAFDVVLIPLQVGCFALPSVNIHLSTSSKESSSYEFHYESAGKVVHVIRDTTRTRVDIIESSSPPNSPPADPDITTFTEAQ